MELSKVFSTVITYAFGFGIFALLFYVTRLLSVFFSTVTELMSIAVKPVITTVEKWVSAINDVLSGGPRSGKSFIAHWFGSPLLIIFMILISGYTGTYIFRFVTSVGAEDALIELFYQTSVFYLIELINQIGTSPNYSAVDILVEGGNALLLAGLTDMFVSQLFPHRSNWLKQPLSYITVTVYGLIFMAFTYVLGDLISVELFANLPQDWWHTTWFTLPILPVPHLEGFGRFAVDLWLRFQWSLNTAVSFGFFFVLLAGFFFILGNVLSSISCCMFSFMLLSVWSLILNLILPDTTNLELLFAALVIVGIVLSEVLFQSEPVSELIESTRPFQFVANAGNNIKFHLEKFFKSLPISTLAILFSGILGGPCFLLAGAGILFFLIDGFSLRTLLTAVFSFLAFLAVSLPCLLSARKRGHSKKVTALYFVFFVCFAIPLANLYYIINIL